MTDGQRAHTSTDLVWFKSSYSDPDGAECVEVAWRKSSHSDPEGANCVEVGACPDTVHVRDSKAPTRAQLALPPVAWRAFVAFAQIDA
jgi:hypothetical protein